MGGFMPDNSELSPAHEGGGLENVIMPERATTYTRYLFVIGFCVYFGMVWYLGWREIGSLLLSASGGPIALAAALLLVGTWARAWKWRYALGPGERAVGIFFLSKGAANWSPARIGEFSPMILRRHRTAKVGAWIMLDRLIEIVVTLVLGLVGLAVIRIVPLGLYCVILAGAVLACVANFYLLTRRAFFLRVAEKRDPASWTHRLAMLMAAVSEELHIFKSRLPIILIVTVITKITDLWAVVLIFGALGFLVEFYLVAAAKCALAMVSFFPFTPTSTAIPHGVQAWMMNTAADIPYEGLVAGIGVEVVLVSVTFWTSFAIGASSLRKPGAAVDSP